MAIALPERSRLNDLMETFPCSNQPRRSDVHTYRHGQSPLPSQGQRNEPRLQDNDTIKGRCLVVGLSYDIATKLQELCHLVRDPATLLCLLCPSHRAAAGRLTDARLKMLKEQSGGTPSLWSGNEGCGKIPRRKKESGRLRKQMGAFDGDCIISFRQMSSQARKEEFHVKSSQVRHTMFVRQSFVCIEKFMITKSDSSRSAWAACNRQEFPRPRIGECTS